jgi:hypothetical protein
MLRGPKGEYNATHLHTLPTLLPIPGLDCHVIAPGKNNACSGVDGETSDVVRMSLKSGYFLVGVVVEDTKLEIVRASNEPVLTRDELDASNRDLRDFESLDDSAGLVVVDVDCAVVETGQDPWFCGVEIYSFYTVRPGEKFPLFASGQSAGEKREEDSGHAR